MVHPIFEPKNGRDFSVMLWPENQLFSSSAGSDLQAISVFKKILEFIQRWDIETQEERSQNP